MEGVMWCGDEKTKEGCALLMFPRIYKGTQTATDPSILAKAV